MGEWPVCSPTTTSFLTQSCKSTEGTGQRCLLAITRPSILFQTRPRWDPRCNFSLGVAIRSIAGIYFTHLRVLGARQKPRTGQRRLLSQARMILSDAWKLFWRGSQRIQTKIPENWRKGSAWIPGCVCTLIPLALSLRQAFCITHQGKLGKREFALTEKKEHMTISNQVQKNPGKTCFHACEMSGKIRWISGFCLCHMVKYLMGFLQGRKTYVRAEQVSSRRGRVCQGVQVETAWFLWHRRATLGSRTGSTSQVRTFFTYRCSCVDRSTKSWRRTVWGLII